MKRLIALFLTCTMLFTATACSNSTDSASSNTSAEAGSALSENVSLEETGVYSFTDSAGRTVELPKNIERIAPSGPLAQVVLYTLVPDKLVGLASEFSDGQKAYIDDKYTSLPVFGNFYADTLNLETVMTADPQVIIDIGEAKKTVKEDMDGIQDKTGIPTIFIEMDLDSMATAYGTLGEVTGSEAAAKKLMDYIEKTEKEIKEKAASIPEGDRKTVYYGQNEGLTAMVDGTVHTDVIPYVGGVNVSKVEQSIRGGASEVSMEQLLLWNPDVILFAPGSIYGEVGEKPEWQELSAIKSGAYYEIPELPYNWMGAPPSVNRIIGMKWLGNLLYPEVYDYDMVKETKEFYELFYHCTVSDEQVKELLSHSTYK